MPTKFSHYSDTVSSYWTKHNFIEAKFGTNLKNTFYTACTLFLCHSQETETTVILAFAQ